MGIGYADGLTGFADVLQIRGLGHPVAQAGQPFAQAALGIPVMAYRARHPGFDQHDVRRIMRHHAAHIGQDALEDLVQVERAVNRCGRIAQGFGQRALIALGAEKLRVLDGDGGLVGKHRQQRDVRLFKRIRLVVLHVHHADDRVADDERHIERRHGHAFIPDLHDAAMRLKLLANRRQIDDARLACPDRSAGRTFASGIGGKSAGSVSTPSTIAKPHEISCRSASYRLMLKCAGKSRWATSGNITR